MKKFFPFLLFVFLIVNHLVFGQEFIGGFKAGFNLSSFRAPSETDDNGRELEEFNASTGFHVGLTFSYNISDQFGLRAEILFSQKGTDYSFNGQSYWVFYPDSGNEIYSLGTRNTVLSIKNSYIDIPLLAYGRIGRLELSGGVNFAFLTSAKGAGETTYVGQTAFGSPAGPFTLALDFRYFDETFEADSENVETLIIDGQTVRIPKTIGAYYETPNKDEKLFEIIDFGLNAGLSVFLNQGLYIGFRVNYGLLDITKKEADLERARLDQNNGFIFRNDLDRNLVFQSSIGFSF